MGDGQIERRVGQAGDRDRRSAYAYPYVLKGEIGYLTGVFVRIRARLYRAACRRVRYESRYFLTQPNFLAEYLAGAINALYCSLQELHFQQSPVSQ